MKQDFEKNRGYWHDTWDQVLDLDPDFFEAYTQFSAVPFRQREGEGEARPVRPRERGRGRVSR